MPVEAAEANFIYRFRVPEESGKFIFSFRLRHSLSLTDLPSFLQMRRERVRNAGGDSRRRQVFNNIVHDIVAIARVGRRSNLLLPAKEMLLRLMVMQSFRVLMLKVVLCVRV